MNGIELALRTLHHGEGHLVGELTRLSERHRADHEVHHVAADVAAWSREHLRRVADAAAHHGLDLEDVPDGPAEASFPAFTAKASDTWAAWSAPGLLLLRDLREAHLAATRNSLHWEMLAQVAQASRDSGLLSLASFCHPRTLRQMRWTSTLIKNLSPQALAAL